MEPASSSEPKHPYSWWRDNHITPKNSRWLQENLTDMDNKIKSMIKVIEEDADSFARRAEMYYKKRPELMKLVEEFYRAYRALAERYDRVTGALRQAHRTIAEAFPNQIQLVLPDEPPSELPGSGEEEKVTFAMPSYSDGNGESHEENNLFLSNEEWKRLTCLLADEEAQTEFAESFLNKSLNLKEDMGKDSELIKLQDEVSKLSKENKSLMNQITSARADKAETESQRFKNAVSKLKSEVESTFLQYQVSQERVSYLEVEISQNREEVRHLNDEMSIKISKLNIAEQRCHDLEIENRSLQLELEKFNEAMSRRFEEVSDLFMENQSLHNTVKSESIRADQAEAETCRLRDAISKLKSEMETALLQYRISQEKVSDLEAEISRAGDQFQKFNKELYIRSSKLNSSEEQCLLLLEENKSLQFTLDKFKMRVTRQEEDITTREEELSKLKQFMEDEHQLFKSARIKENISLQLDLNKFKQRNLTQEEEIAAREKELDKLIQSLEDEGQKRMIAEMAHESMKKLYSQSEEKVRLLGLEIQSGTESLRRMELSKVGLGEEIKRLYDENNDLREKRLSSVSKIVGLQDEIGSLRKSKRKAEDEVKFHVDENKVLRRELSSLKNERNDLEDRHFELTAQIGEVNFNVVSLQAFVKDLLEGKKELKDACKKHEDEKAFNLKNLRLMESISEKNFFLENSLSDVTAELELLREKIKGLEKCCESLHNNTLSHESDTSMLVSHVDVVTQNIKKLSQKNTLIEDSFADINVEFDGLRGKVKTLEESCQSLYYQNCYLIADNSNLVSQVGRIGQHIQSLENHLSTLEGKHVNMEKEKNVALHQLEELKDLFRSEKEEHENHTFLFRSQTSALNNQMHLLKEENHLKSKKLEEEELKTAGSDIECFIMHKALYDITEKNIVLSDECQKCMEKLRCAEKLTLELKQDQLTHNKKLASLLDHNKKLLEWLHVMAKEDGETSNVVNEDMKQLNPQKIVDLPASYEEMHQLCLEKSAFTILFGQLGLSLAELRAQKNIIEQESEKKNHEILVSHRKNHEFMEVNKHLKGTIDRNQQTEEFLVEMETMHGELSDIQGVRCTVLGEIPKLFAESEYFSKKLYGSREQTDAREEENEVILEEAKFREHLSCVFRSSNAAKSSEVDQLISDIDRLHGITDELRQNIGEINENMRVLQSENMHLRDLVVNFETRNPVVLKGIDKLCNAFPELKPQIEAGKNQLEQRDMESFKNAELLVNIEGLVVELNKANMVKEELEKNILSLSKDIVCKNDEIEILHQSNDNLVEEYSKLHKEAEAMRSREKNLASELQSEKDESRCCEEESAAYLIEIHAASVNQLIFRQTVAELMLKFESLEARDSVQSEMPNGVISVRNAQMEELLEKLDSLERENKELRADLSVYVPLAVSLDNDMLSSKAKQGNLLAPLQRKKLSQVRAKDHSSKISSGILELKRLHAKVKVLQKAVTDTEKLLAQEEIVVDTNVDSETKNSKVRGSKGQLETIKKKDITSGIRKSNAAGKDFKPLKDDQEVSKIKHEQMMKDIQLDHVLSSSRHGGDSSAETDEQSHEACEPATGNDIEYHQIEIMEEERSEKPSSEVVLVKELSVDKIELPVNDTESHQEWGRRVGEALSFDAQRLSILQKSLVKLKKSIRVSEMSNQPSIPQLNSVSEQLKEFDGVIMQLIDINFTLAKIADSFSASQGGNEGRRQIWERVRKASEKIGGVEVDLQNMQFILSKLLEEQEGKKAKALEGKSRVPLKDLIYSKRNDLRQNKRRLCACMRLKTKGD